MLTVKISDWSCLSKHLQLLWINGIFVFCIVFKTSNIFLCCCFVIYTKQGNPPHVFWFSGLFCQLDCRIMSFFLCSQVSYFEIYLDKIRDLLDGKWLQWCSGNCNKLLKACEMSSKWISICVRNMMEGDVSCKCTDYLNYLFVASVILNHVVLVQSFPDAFFL